MSDLGPRERALVALGAAIGSNCVPCVEHHIPRGRTAGLSDSEISAAILLADEIRQVPARKVLGVALRIVETARSDAAQSQTVKTLQPVCGGEPSCA